MNNRNNKYYIMQLIALAVQIALAAWSFNMQSEAKRTAALATALVELSKFTGDSAPNAIETAAAARATAKQVLAERLNGSIEKIKREIRQKSDDGKFEHRADSACTPEIEKYFKDLGFMVKTVEEKETNYLGHTTYAESVQTSCLISWGGK